MKYGKLIVIVITLSIFACLLEYVYATEDTNSVSNYLCDYAIRLYKEGAIIDAINYFKKALMISPNNVTAQDYLRKILSTPIPQNYKEGLKDTKARIEQLNSQLIQLQEENRSYKEQLNALGGKPAEKDNASYQLIQQLKSQNERLKVDLSKKEQVLEKLKSDFDNRSKVLGDEVKAKESKIKELIDEKDLLSGEIKKIKSQQVTEIEKVMKLIADILPKKKSKKTGDSYF